MAEKFKWELNTLAPIVAGVGALNWGLNAMNFNLVTKFPAVAQFATPIYWVIAAAGAYLLLKAFGMVK